MPIFDKIEKERNDKVTKCSVIKLSLKDSEVINLKLLLFEDWAQIGLWEPGNVRAPTRFLNIFWRKIKGGRSYEVLDFTLSFANNRIFIKKITVLPYFSYSHFIFYLWYIISLI